MALSFMIRLSFMGCPVDNYGRERDSDLESHSRRHPPHQKCLKEKTIDMIKYTTFLNVEEELLELVKNLTTTLAHVNQKMIAKDEEVRNITARIAKLEAKRKKGKSILKKEPGGGVGDAICIFSEEVWKLIFDNLTECDDLWNCTRTCKLFQAIIDPSKAIFIQYEIFPTLYKYLTEYEISLWSWVCQAWNSGIHHFFENDCRVLMKENLLPTKAVFDREGGTGYGRLLIESNSVIRRSKWVYEAGKYSWPWNMWNCERVYDEYSEHDCLPFMQMPRYNESGVNSRNSVRKFVRHYENSMRDITLNGPSLEVEEFLKCFGEHVRYLTEQMTADVALGICFIRQVPNLRQLCLFHSHWYHPDNTKEIKPEWLVASPHLQTLQIDGLLGMCRIHSKSHVSHPVVDVLLKTYHLQLKRLDVWKEHWVSNSRLGWPNLTELNIHMCQCFKVTNEIIPQANMPNLRKLGLRIEGDSYDGYFDDLIISINNLSMTTRLDTLRLTGRIMVMPNINRKTLTAPSTLKTLEVENFCWLSERDGSMTCYNFLLYFPFVETINAYWVEANEHKSIPEDFNGLVDRHIQYERWDLDSAFRGCSSSSRWKNAILNGTRMQIERRLKRELVNVHEFAYQGCMYESNIWELLPRLKVFTFQKDVYTREKYETLRNLENPQPKPFGYFELFTDSIMLWFKHNLQE